MIKMKFAITLALTAAATTAVANNVEFHRDVMPLVAERCMTCHATDGVSFPLETPDEAWNFRMAIASAVAEERMPPWLAEDGHQEYVGDYSLTDEEKALVAAWAAAGYPRADSTDLPTPKPVVFEFAADLSLDVLPEDSYLPRQDRKDDYRCFIVDWPYEREMYVTGFHGEPGNLKVAHHLVNFAVGPEGAEILKQLSAEEEGPGHQCFTGPVPDRLASKEGRAELEKRYPGGWDKIVNNYFWLSHWAPGMYGEDFPPDTGILMRPGSVVVVQMHYYSAFAPGESDADTKMHFKVAESVEKPSVNLPMTDNRWLYAGRNGTMEIEPGKSRTYETGRSFENIARYASHALRIPPDQVSALELQSANIHMHSYGASGVASLVHADGSKETLLSIPRWDLDWQRDFMFTEGIRIPRDEFEGSRLVVECTFSNYADYKIVGGYGSDDEMCFNFSYVSVIRGEPTDAAAD